MCTTLLKCGKSETSTGFSAFLPHFSCQKGFLLGHGYNYVSLNWKCIHKTPYWSIIFTTKRFVFNASKHQIKVKCRFLPWMQYLKKQKQFYNVKDTFSISLTRFNESLKVYLKLNKYYLNRYKCNQCI